jgi:hypothetical protein
MSAANFHQMTVRILRPEDLGNGRVGPPVEVIPALDVTPLWPLSPETLAEIDINSPREYKETYHAEKAEMALPDVREGDIMETPDGRTYPIDSVAEWIDRDIPTLRMVVQEVKF